MKKILFVAPHPDDESFGCAGSILKHSAEGDEIYWLIVTSGTREDGNSPEVIMNMEAQVARVNEFYGFNDHRRLQFASTRLDAVPMRELVSAINDYINEVQPHTVYVNFKHDVHTDHKSVFDAVWSCSKSFRNPFIKRVLVYETLSETEFSDPADGVAFQPNTFIDISHFLERKLEVLNFYKSELQTPPFPRSLENVASLAKLRGSTVNVDAAEAFMCIKQVL